MYELIKQIESAIITIIAVPFMVMYGCSFVIQKFFRVVLGILGDKFVDLENEKQIQRLRKKID